MSEWYEAELDDISIGHKEKEVDIYVTHNYIGNIYVTLTSDQLREILKMIDYNEKSE